jgi:VCBS repeat-containing protein
VAKIVATLEEHGAMDHTVVVLAGASDPAHGTASVQANGTVLYTPDKRFKGTDTFTYTATDGQAESAPATVTIQVTASKPKGG